MDFLTKDYKLDLKELTEEGAFEGYAAVFGNRDEQGDIIEPGAFKKTLKENDVVPVLWMHNPHEPTGVTVELSEDSKGLYVKGQLNPEVQKAKEVYTLLKQKALKGISIGYNTVKETWEGSTRYLKEIRLWEISLVTFPANRLAQVTNVKNECSACVGLQAEVDRLNALLADNADKQEPLEDASKPLLHLLEEVRSYAQEQLSDTGG
jgi:hypothetical protein